jgi:hypothetical protein
MKKNNKQHTNYSRDKKIDPKLLSQQVSKLLEDSVPKNILGMLATATELEDGILIDNRWKLSAVDRNDYYILDTRTGDKVYKNIALFANAVQIIWYLTKPIRTSAPMDKVLFELDQEYYRCLEDIKHYMGRTTANKELGELFSIRLEQSKYRLQDIKTEISKIY